MAIWGWMLSRKIGGRHYDRGIGLFDRGFYEQAIHEFLADGENAHAGGGVLKSRLTRFYLGESYSALALAQLAPDGTTDDAASAIENLKKAITLRPGYADLHFHLGRAHFKTGQSLRAIGSLSKALDINPSYARAALQLGIVLYSVNRHEEGFLYADRAIQINPKLQCEWLSAAHDAHRQGDYVNALTLLERIGEAPRDAAAAHVETADCLVKSEHLVEAVKEYRKAVAIQPFYADVRNKLGVTLCALGSYEEAVEEFMLAVRINPKYIEGRLNLALALEQVGKWDEAIREFDIVLAADSENPVALQRREALSVSRPLLK